MLRHLLLFGLTTNPDTPRHRCSRAQGTAHSLGYLTSTTTARPPAIDLHRRSNTTTPLQSFADYRPGRPPSPRTWSARVAGRRRLLQDRCLAPDRPLFDGDPRSAILSRICGPLEGVFGSVVHGSVGRGGGSGHGSGLSLVTPGGKPLICNGGLKLQ